MVRLKIIRLTLGLFLSSPHLVAREQFAEETSAAITTTKRTGFPSGSLTSAEDPGTNFLKAVVLEPTIQYSLAEKSQRVPSYAEGGGNDGDGFYVSVTYTDSTKEIYSVDSSGGHSSFVAIECPGVLTFSSSWSMDMFTVYSYSYTEAGVSVSVAYYIPGGGQPNPW